MIIRIQAPNGILERGLAAYLRIFFAVTFRFFIGPRLGVKAQRFVTQMLALLMPGQLGVLQYKREIQGINTHILTPKRDASQGVILFFHGGAFCLGSSYTHRSVCSRLAHEAGCTVWVPNYRLAPEHPYPAALDDALTIYRALLKDGFSHQKIVIAGDSAGASLALALCIALKNKNEELPSSMMLISPVVDGDSVRQVRFMGGRDDPIITLAWMRQAVKWFNPPKFISEFSPLQNDLSGLPPMLIQVGQEEILLNDSLQLEAHATKSGVKCLLELYLERWHVFHLQGIYLKSSKLAIRAMAVFALSNLQENEL